MKRVIRFAMGTVVLFFGMLCAVDAMASVTVTVGSPVSNPQSGAYLLVTLQNCQSPSIVNSGTTVPPAYTFYFNSLSSLTVTLPDNVTQIACSGNSFSYYTFTYVAGGAQTVIKSVELPPGIFNLANLANLTSPPFNPGVIQGPPGPAGPQGSSGSTVPLTDANLLANTTALLANSPSPTANLTVHSVSSVFPDPTTGVLAFGCDSVCVGTGSTGPVGPNGFVYNPANSTAFESLLAQSVGGKNQNFGYGGSQTADGVTAQMFANNLNPTNAGNPLAIENLGENEVLHCPAVSGGGDGGGSGGCLQNAGFAQRTLDTWMSTTNKVYGVQATLTGTWTADSNLARYALQSTSAGSSATFPITSPTGGVCVAWEAYGAGSSATAALSIDGGAITDTLQAYGYQGQTVTTGYVGSTWTVWTQCYNAGVGAHSVKVTVSGGSPFAVVAVHAPNPLLPRNIGPPRVVSIGVIYLQNDADSAAMAAVNTQKQANVATLAALGYPVVFADVRSLVDPIYDMSSTVIQKPVPGLTTITCPASTAPPYHPNDCGHRDIFLSIQRVTGGGGSPSQLASPLLLPAVVGDNSSYNANGVLSQTAINPAWCGYIANNLPHCDGMTYRGLPYNTFALTRYAPVGDLITFGHYAGGAAPTSQASIVDDIVISSTGVGINPVLNLASGYRIVGSNLVTAVTKYTLNVTPTSVAAQTCSNQSFTATGVLVNDGFSTLSVPALMTGLTYTVQPSGANTVNMQFCNITASAIIPAAGTYAWTATSTQ